ncbi:MAG: transporter permease [Thermoleophilia bacterium]|nr:transporter permease [Thermoleophilia bacterium]
MPILEAMPPHPRLAPLSALIATVLVACLALVVPATAGAAILAPASKQILRVGIGTLPTSIDPGKAAYEEDRIVQDMLFPALYRSPAGASGRLIPYLASGQPTVSNGGLRYTVTLRPTRWSDGMPVTAADVKLGYTRARPGFYGTFFSPVRSVTAIGARTIRFDLTMPVPWFGELLASSVVAPVPSHVVKARGARWTHLTYLVTAGPFKVASGRGRSELVLARNPEWWGARSVRLKEVQLLAVASASVSPTFRAGRLDVTLRNGSIHPSALTSWKDDPRFHEVPRGDGQYLYLNTKVPELANPAVRRGIALAIDRAAIGTIVRPGLDQPLATIMPDDIRGAASVNAGSRLLAASGVAEPSRANAELAAGAWVRGPKLDLYYATTGKNALIVGQIQANLASVGVDVVPHPTAQSDFAKTGIGISPTRSDVDMVLQGWLPDYSDPQNFHQLFTCANVDAGLNTSNLCSPEFDATYASAVNSTGGARLDAHRALEDLLTGPSGLMPAVPLYRPVGDNLVQTWVAGFSQHASGRVDFEKVAILLH